VGAEIQLAAAAVADVGVELGRCQIGVAEHLLDAAQIRSALEQVGGERVSEQVRVDPSRFEARLLGQTAQHKKDTRAREAAALSVQEELRPVAPVEVWAPAREIAAERIGGRPAEGDDPLLCSLAGRSDEPLIEVDVRLAEPNRLTDAQPGPVEQLDDRAIA
jgi:hypothetical protein